MTTLDPNLLAALRAAGVDPSTVFQQGDMTYQPRYDAFSYLSPEAGGSANPTAQGPMRGWDMANINEGGGRMISEFDTDGTMTGQRADNRNTLPGDLLKFAGMAMGINGIGEMLTAGAQAGAASGAGFIGEGVPSGIGAWDKAFLNAGGQWAPGFVGPGMSDAGDLIDNFSDAGGDDFLPDPNTGGPGEGGGPGSDGIKRLANDLPNVPPAGAPITGGGVNPLSVADLGIPKIASFTGPLSLIDKATNWLSDPGNLLKAGGALLGAIGGSQERDGAQSTNVRTLDPRIDSRIFGAGGLLEMMDAQLKANPTGQNDAMRAGQDMVRNVINHPSVMPGLLNMGNMGQSMMNNQRPVYNWSPLPGYGG